MSQTNQYSSKYDEVYGFGACFVVFLITVFYLFTQNFTTSDPLHYHLVFGVFAALLTLAFGYRTLEALKLVNNS